jgi:hypothetical protein
MSQITTIHDGIYTLMSTLFPAKKMLSDNLFIDNNDELLLANGYAIYFGPAVNTNRVVGCKQSTQRQVTIIMTTAVYGGHKSIDKLIENEKSLLEDHYTLIKNFNQNANLDTMITKRNYIDDNGIERVLGQSKNFLMIETNFEIEYFEDFS